MKNVIALLQTERAELLDRVAKVDAAIAALGGKPGRSRSSTQPGKPARRRRNMSDEERKAASERMKNYWGGASEAICSGRCRQGWEGGDKRERCIDEFPMPSHLEVVLTRSTGAYRRAERMVLPVPAPRE